ncbi:MAG: hypothetical protein PHC80_01915 [Eubacteriales bacterium]|nr:hypothetical protein [Eubacteriales bacterium]
MPIDTNMQISAAARNAAQAYAAQATRSAESGGLFSDMLQTQMTGTAAQGLSDTAVSAEDKGMAMLLPLLIGSLCSGSSATSGAMLSLVTLLQNKYKSGSNLQYSEIGSVMPWVQRPGDTAQSQQAEQTQTAAPKAAEAQDNSAEKSARFAAAERIISNVGNRSAALYRAVVDQFNVENNARYQPRDGSTYCNIFQWDVTKAMGAEIPHHTNANTGAPTTKDDPDVRYMNANRISDWLNSLGEKYGWYEVSAEQAQRLANQGHPAVTIWKNNSGGHGHCQVVVPSEDGTYDPVKGVAIAQAGRRLFNNAYITNVYSASLPEVQYFAHA